MAVFAIIARSLQQVATLVITLLAARFLLPVEYGVYALGVVFLALIQTLTYTGFYQFVITSDEPEDQVLGTSFWLITGLAFAAAGVLAVLAYPLEWLFDTPKLGLVLVLLAVSQPFASFSAWASATLLRREAVNANFVVMFFQNLAGLVGGVVLLIMWQSLFALVAYRFIRVAAGLILYLMAGVRFPGFAFNRALAKKATSFSGGLYGSRFLAYLAKYSSDILLGLYYSAAELGLFRFGSRLAGSATDIIVQPMSNFAISHLGAEARREKLFEPPARRFVGAISLLSGMAGAAVIVFVQDLVLLFFNDAYLPAVAVAFALALRGALGAGNTMMEPVFSAMGRTSWTLYYNVLTAISAILAILVTVPFGYIAVAWGQVAVTVASTMWAFAMINFVGRINVTGMLRSYFVAICLAATFGVVMWFGYDFIRDALPYNPMLALIAGLGLGFILGPITLAIGSKLQVFTLDVFRG